MKVDIVNIVRELKTKDPIFPLYEVIVNSIHAIIEKGNVENGVINVFINRSDSTQLSIDNSKAMPAITGFKVYDNGIGFTNKHFESFNTAYSGQKLEFGCKGVGRFVILSIFKNLEVKSVFKHTDSTNKIREFEFNERGITPDGSKLTDVPNESESFTEVTLAKLAKAFEKNYSIVDIAYKIIKHCLIYFITNQVPRIVLYDKARGEEIDLRDIYDELISGFDILDSFEIEGEVFEIIYVKKYLRNASHRIHYCAADREVVTKNLKNFIPNLTHRLEDDKGGFYLSAYVRGKYLTDNVSTERGDLIIPKTIEAKNAYEKISMQEIDNNVVQKVKDLLEEELKEIEEQSKSQVHEYVYSGKGVEYKHLLNKDEVFSMIPPDRSDSELDDILHKINYKYESVQRKRVRSFLSKDIEDIKSIPEYQEELSQVLAEEKELNEAKLANYVLQRKAVIDLLKKFISAQKDDEFKYESDIHNIIFPMKKDSSEISFSKHNLWLLDEKFTFHPYISHITSDKELKDSRVIESRSGEAPDLAIYGKTFAFGKEESSVVLFEFKRPDRKFYGEEQLLDNQIKRYIKRLIESKEKDYRGRRVKITPATPKFGYIVCDYTDKLEEELVQYQGYTSLPYGGFFKYEKGINLYLEVFDYDQLVSNAEVRHKAFFKQLGLDLHKDEF